MNPNRYSTALLILLITACSQKPNSEPKLGDQDISTKGVIKEDLSVLSDFEFSKVLKWQHSDLELDNLYGVSADVAYASLLKNHKRTEVIVAVIDSGVDIFHEDLKSNIWTNSLEIPGNGIDDDNNGYIDDIHGWNFIGGVDGSHLSEDSLEETRVFKKLNAKIKRGETLTINEQIDHIKAKTFIDEGLDKYSPLYNQSKKDLETYELSMRILKQKRGIESITLLSEIEDIDSEDLEVMEARESLQMIWKKYSRGIVGLQRIFDQSRYYVEIGYNSELRDREEIVGDDPSDFTDIRYGNNDVKGPDSRHGTHVAGTIAAIRENGIGMNGIADNVKIMALRVVPKGDERDKDIALAIRYAADNGAKIINMSFGKKFSPYKEEVDEAFEYAAKKGVIFFHSAGNDSLNNDGGLTAFPNSYKRAGSGVLKVNTIPNWVEVGASTKDNNHRIAASFSNYGQESVTLFSPGQRIYATTPENTYAALSGTSMAAPVASGVAAVIMGTYPSLSSEAVLDILKESVSKASIFPVIMPGGTISFPVSFSRLSETGGVINLQKALELAKQRVTNQ